MIEDIKSFMKDIEMLNKKLDAQDKIINTQALEIARLKEKSEILEENNKLLIQQKYQMYKDLDIAYDKIDKAIEYIKSYLPNYDFDHSNLDELLEILGDKENENKYR